MIEVQDEMQEEAWVVDSLLADLPGRGGHSVEKARVAVPVLMVLLGPWIPVCRATKRPHEDPLATRLADSISTPIRHTHRARAEQLHS